MNKSIYLLICCIYPSSECVFDSVVAASLTSTVIDLLPYGPYCARRSDSLKAAEINDMSEYLYVLVDSHTKVFFDLKQQLVCYHNSTSNEGLHDLQHLHSCEQSQTASSRET